MKLLDIAAIEQTQKQRQLPDVDSATSEGPGVAPGWSSIDVCIGWSAIFHCDDILYLLISREEVELSLSNFFAPFVDKRDAHVMYPNCLLYLLSKVSVRLKIESMVLDGKIGLF